MPAIDWGETTTIAAVGIGMVLVVLAILAVATWLAGVLLHRIDNKRDRQTSQQKTKG